MKIREYLLLVITLLFFSTNTALAQSYVLESTDTTTFATDTNAAAGTVWENQFYGVGINDNNSVVVYYPDGTSSELTGVSGPIYHADGKWIMAETEDTYTIDEFGTFQHFGARVELIDESTLVMSTASDSLFTSNIHIGLDVLGGLSGAADGNNPSFQCPGMETSEVTQIDFSSNQAATDVDCSTETIITLKDQNSSSRQAVVVEDIFGTPTTKNIGLSTNTAETNAFSAFHRLANTQFDSTYTALVQNSNIKGASLCYLYRGSTGESTTLQQNDTCIALTNNFVVFQDSADQCTVLNTDGDRLPLIQQSTGMTYTGCVDADEVNGELYVTVDFGGTTSVVKHQISSTDPNDITDQPVDSVDPEPSTAIVFGDCVDSDGDGWGWDGERSCRIPPGIQNSNENSAANCVDTPPLNDGWGWNFARERSCRIPRSGPPQGPRQSALSACVDTDGDGYGWDGLATCLCEDSDGDGYGWTGTASCRVGV